VPGRSNGKPLLDDEKSMEMNLRSEIYQLFWGDLTAPTWETIGMEVRLFCWSLQGMDQWKAYKGIALRMLCQEDGA